MLADMCKDFKPPAYVFKDFELGVHYSQPLTTPVSPMGMQDLRVCTEDLARAWLPAHGPRPFVHV